MAVNLGDYTTQSSNPLVMVGKCCYCQRESVQGRAIQRSVAHGHPDHAHYDREGHECFICLRCDGKKA